MISYLHLKNFKSFSDIFLDLRGAHGIPKHVAFIYGENGAGKSNLMLALLFVLQSLETIGNQESVKKFMEFKEEILKESDDDNSSEIKHKLLNELARRSFFSLSDILKRYKMFNSVEPLVVEVGFYVNNHNGVYRLECSNDRVISESLNYQIEKRTGTVFSIDRNHDAMLSPKVFFDKNYCAELLENIDKYWGKHTFLAILQDEIEKKNRSYIEKKIRKNLLEIITWFSGLAVWHKGGQGEFVRINLPDGLLYELDSGRIKKKNDIKLKISEDILNQFFTQTYSDIKRAYYVIEPMKQGFHYELHFEKMIEGNMIDIPISQESTGTQKLLTIFPFLVVGFEKVVCVDEIDSGIHDLLMKVLIENLIDITQGQLIVTTHNTLLLESLPHNNIYVISIDANGSKKIVCLKDYPERIQKTNNVRHKYLRGDYGGIPMTEFVDFYHIKELVQKAQTSHNVKGV